jgi:hypothetical protein
LKALLVGREQNSQGRSADLLVEDLAAFGAGCRFAGQCQPSMTLGSRQEAKNPSLPVNLFERS